MPLSRTLRTRTALLLTSALVLSAVSSPGTASAAEPTPAPASGVPSLKAPATVTLLTGDRVTLTPTKSGTPRVDVRSRDGRTTTTGYTIRNDKGRITVVPHAVQGLVPSVLDPALFDVTGLVEMRYDDAHRADTPIIVREAPGARTMASTGFAPTRHLATMNATAGRLAKSRTATFGASLTAGAPRPAKIWLDAAVQGASTTTGTAAPLDSYLDQMNAPEAWDRGLDGRGVKVAVVDSGIDSGHPALAGKVTAAADFTGEGTQDDLGHGTHVASLVAGTGAGSDGARHGVAPGVELISSKVLNAQDEGTTSGVIAGMEWAVEQNADLVNVSLGGRAPQYGEDLLAEAVDRLTASSGALFVVAAGNNGLPWPAPFSIQSPGTAASALTVGAVDGTDHKAYFSSEGPTWSYVQKPEVSAPGVDIPGARAGARDGDLYVAYSGTSQATPLVTASAALLLHQHPELTWQQLKARLSSAVDDTGTYTSWSGSGRVNLDKATSAGLSSDLGVLDFGAIRHPDDAKQTRTVTLTNPGSTPVTVTAADHQVQSVVGTPAPDTAVVVSPATVTVAPGGTARLTVTLDPAVITDDMWQGSVDLLGADGKDLLRLALNAYDEPPMYDVAVQVLDRAGQPVSGGWVNAFNAATGGFVQFVLDEQGRATRRLSPGEWSMYSWVTTGDTLALVGGPNHIVTGETAVTLDARRTVRLNIPVVEGVPTKATTAAFSALRGSQPGKWQAEELYPSMDDVTAGRIYLQPTAAPTTGITETVTRWQLQATKKAHRSDPDVYEVYQSADHFTLPLAKNLDRKAVRNMARVDTTFGGVWGSGTTDLGRGSASAVTNFGGSIWQTTEVPSHRIEMLSAGPGIRWWQCLDLPSTGQSGVCDDPFRSYQPGERVRSVFGTAMHPQVSLSDFYGGVFNVQVGVADPGHVGVLDTPQFATRPRLTLHRNGQLVGDVDDTSGFFGVPDGPARWRLEHSWRNDQLPSSTEARTTWEFTATPPATADENPVRPPMMRLDYDPYVALDGSAPAFRPLVFDLRVGYLPHAATSTVESSRLWVSSDRGKHWSPVPLIRTKDGYRTVVAPHMLRPGHTLSVRAAVTDRAGNSVDQTVLDLVPVR
ncbi:S8 family serine peptidase [Kribbella shirazensis]|uniref:Subtilisin family serine protease n=1 Tax=Kribbella shirazensis TaxID=1105143 RepID=A0A7X5V7M0_9ACTN|nr:S8 family serine peptidase [Kribbella shirazensis]NIK55358.1 subtilisin family serine protease [Kribbella shirazensis]